MSFGSMANRRVTAYRGRYVKIEFELDRAGFRKIAMSPPVRAATTAVVVDRAMPYAVSISPYDPKSKGPHYRDQFKVTQGSMVIAGLRRVSTRLFNVSDHSTEVEWKNGNRVLTRTVAYLEHDSVLQALAAEAGQAARRAKKAAAFQPDEHPRDPRGRFRRKGGPAGG